MCMQDALLEQTSHYIDNHQPMLIQHPYKSAMWNELNGAELSDVDHCLPQHDRTPICGVSHTVCAGYIFVTCQNLHFGKYVGLTVCLSVCPSLYKIKDNSRTLWDIFTKISPQVYLGCSSIAISFQCQRSKVKVTRSPHRSKLEIAVTPLIFELQKNVKKHNVVLLKAHPYDIINFRYHFRFKRSPEVENRKCEIAISIFVSFQHSSNLMAYLETTCQI